MSAPDRPWDADDGTKKSESKAGLWGIGVVVAVIAICASGALFGAGGDEPDEYGAQVACENRVKDLLKSPGTADFSNPTRTELSPTSWRIEGHVDSENSFGGTVRTNFTCEATSIGGDNWRVRVPEIG